MPFEAPAYQSQEAEARSKAEWQTVRICLAIFGIGVFPILIASQVAFGFVKGGAAAFLWLTPLLFVLGRFLPISYWASGRIDSPSLLDASNRPFLLAASSFTCLGPFGAGMFLVPLSWFPLLFLGFVISLAGFVVGFAGGQPDEGGREF
jgi:hypothetical protein